MFTVRPSGRWPIQAVFWLEWGSSPRTQFPRRPLAFSRRPFRLDLDPSLTASCVVSKTAPLPIFRTFAQTRLHRIAMNIAKLLHKLRVISNVEIVVPLLPEMLRIANQAPRYSLLQRLQRIGQRSLFCQANRRLIQADRWPIQAVLWLEWGTSTAVSLPLRFAEQKMHMLRHDHITRKPEA